MIAKRAFKRLSLFIVLCVLTGCSAKISETPELLTPVGAKTDIVTVKYGDMLDMLAYTAVAAPKYVDMFFKSDKRIGAVNVSVGDTVSAGDVIMTLDTSASLSAISNLDNELKKINETAEYEKSLYDIDMELYDISMELAETESDKYDIETEKLLYDLEYQNAASARDERFAAIATEKVAYEGTLTETELTAPCSGKVTYIGVNPGQSVGAYSTVCVITDENSVQIQTKYIQPSVISGAVEIYMEIGGERYSVQSEDIDEDEYARAVLKGVEMFSSFSVTGDKPEIVSGDYAAMYIVTAKKENALVIPLNALFEDSGQYYVYIMDGESRLRREVTPGLITSTEVEILYGAEEGEQVYVGD